MAEFFAGIGLVRAALERCDFDVVWANDIEPAKLAMYAENHPAEDFVLGDIRAVRGKDMPDIELATASFPCTDLSLAGNRAGLAGDESSMFWEFARILKEMGSRRPEGVMLENVPSFATSHGGQDFRDAIKQLNRLGYACDAMVIDAKWFVPQSRPRLFIVGSRSFSAGTEAAFRSPIRPAWIREFAKQNPRLKVQAVPVGEPRPTEVTLSTAVEKLRPADERWWDLTRTARFILSLSEIQTVRLEAMRRRTRKSWATAYRRTRYGRAVWEIRADAISGCLRTARGGSSKQALVEAGRGEVRVRWMTPREYARLQGAGDYKLGSVSDNQALFGFGDAVCVPAVEWVARHYLSPMLTGTVTPAPSEVELAKAA